MTATAQTSTGMDYMILTPDKQGGQSMCQHHKKSTDESSFTDGGHSS